MIPQKNGSDFWNQHPLKPPGTTFHQNRTKFWFWLFLGRGTRGPITHYIAPGNDVTTKLMPFLKSAPSKTLGNQISSKSDNFSFRSLFGGSAPKKHKFFGQKKFGPKFWPHIRTWHIRKPLYTKFQLHRMTFENWLKVAKKCLKRMQKFLTKIIPW